MSLSASARGRQSTDLPRRAGLPLAASQTVRSKVEEQINFWTIASLEGLNEVGKRAQEKILGIPKRLERVADAMETRSRAKTFSFAVAFAREFSMS